jgi:hypothetical protein
MFDLPQNTTVSVGLATKPYPSFRLPGMNKYSVAYHSNGEKSFHYPFTSATFGASLKEGDILGVGYRPRSGTVFFTRNGRKMDDAFTGLSRWNLFPTIGADGPCTVHVNFGQAGFVFIEANVKKWGLAPSIGTLAPPPPYGSERGSILLDVGGDHGSHQGTPSASSPSPSRRSQRARRSKPVPNAAVHASSPLRSSPLVSPVVDSPPPPITPIAEESEENPIAGPSSSRRYISPTDMPFHTPANSHLPASPSEDNQADADQAPDSSSLRSQSPVDGDASGTGNPFSSPRRPPPRFAHLASELSHTDSGSTVQQVLSPPESPMAPNPPTPNPTDIHLQALTSRSDRDEGMLIADSEPALRRRDPPSYSPLDANMYADGVRLDLPAEVIAAAMEGGSIPSSTIGRTRSDRRRSSNRRR